MFFECSYQKCLNYTCGSYYISIRAALDNNKSFTVSNALNFKFMLLQNFNAIFKKNQSYHLYLKQTGGAILKTLVIAYKGF